MNGLKFRHTTKDSQSFLFSLKESDEEYYVVAYELTKRLLIGVAKRALAFNSRKYGISELPFLFRERQLDTLILPELALLCKGLVFAEYPVERRIRKKRQEIEEWKGRIDYLCIYKDYTFVIEVKHSYDNFETPVTCGERLLERWKTMNKEQLPSVKDYVKHFEERTKGVIRLGLHFVISHSNTNISENVREEYILQERAMLNRLYKDLQTIMPPDFMSVWELDDDMVYHDCAYPGLILLAKFFKEIKHKGSKG